ncbi:hypothetical protein ANN_06412 [Periplaneta americana]|uniref:Uncharacterized protein n=1 Tax=Periplaneta americana TaxID=6978 RepID=A0ABQ8TF29_PERAM|nr:hypothetical protein ANN_06412 [Periplaneta americana]
MRVGRTMATCESPRHGPRRLRSSRRSINAIEQESSSQCTMVQICLHLSNAHHNVYEKALFSANNLFYVHKVGILNADEYCQKSTTNYEVRMPPNAKEIKDRINDAIDKLNKDIDSIVTWTKKFHLNINPGKTQAIILGHKRQTDAVKHLDISPLKTDITRHTEVVN